MSIANPQTEVEAPVELESRGIRMEYFQRRTQSKLLALDEFTTSVRQGEFVTIVGPSGCGKTTFLKIVNGLIKPTAGTVLLRNKPIAASSRERAMVFQDASLFPWFTVARNVAYGLECRKVPEKERRERVQPYIDLVGLHGFENHFPHELSGGMQQRVNLARALAVEPNVLLMDEPFAALDAQTREIMQSELLRIWSAERKTVLFITHQIDEAIYLSDRVIAMSARPGRILADIPIEIPRPRDLEVKQSDTFRSYTQQIWRLISAQTRITMARTDHTETPAPADAEMDPGA